MSRGCHTFKQGDLTKALKAAAAAGQPARRVEIAPDGKIAMILGAGGDDPMPPFVNPWDDAPDGKKTAL